MLGATVDNVGGGAAALLRPLVGAVFDIAQAGQRAKAAEKMFLLDRKRQKLLNPVYVPTARKPLSPVVFIAFAAIVVLVLIIVLGMFASSTATSSSKLGIVASKTTASGKTKTVRRVRKKP